MTSPSQTQYSGIPAPIAGSAVPITIQPEPTVFLELPSLMDFPPLVSGQVADGVFDSLYVNNINIAGSQTGGGAGLTLPLTQNLTFSPDNTWNIGAAATNRPAILYVGQTGTFNNFLVSSNGGTGGGISNQIWTDYNNESMLIVGAGNTLELRNATNPQVFRIYQTFTNVTTYSRLEVGYSGFWSQFAIDVIESPNLFTGLFFHSAGSITARGETGVTLQTIGAGNDIIMSPQANTWRFASSGGAQAGALVPIADGARNIGTTALRVGSIFVLNQLVSYSQIINQGTFATGVGVQLNFGGSYLYSASGVPSNAQGVNGDFYFRTDTPGTANQRLYVRSAGAWVGIV